MLSCREHAGSRAILSCTNIESKLLIFYSGTEFTELEISSYFHGPCIDMGVLSSFSGISVNDEILSQYNPLFIVNSKTNVRCVFVLLFMCMCKCVWH